MNHDETWYDEDTVDAPAADIDMLHHDALMQHLGDIPDDRTIDILMCAIERHEEI